MKEKINKYWFFIPFLLLSVFYLIKVPIGQTPDEPAHIDYIESITNFGILPSYQRSGVAHHPPFYYLLMAPFYFVFKNVYLIRAFSIIFSFLNLLIIIKIVKTIFYKKKEYLPIALGTAVFCSLIPMYNFIGIAVSNDPLTSLLGSAIIYFTLLSLNSDFSKKQVKIWALAFVAAIFTKIVLWPSVFISGIIIFFLQKERRKSILFVFLFSLLGLCLWFYHNLSQYGNWDILGWKKLKEVEYFLTGNRLIFDNPREWLITVFHSFWGIFSWFSIYLPLSVYSILRKVTVFLAVPFIFFVYDFFKETDKKSKITFLLFFSFFIINFIALVKDNLVFFHPQGRYLFSVISVVGFYYSAAIFTIAKFVSKIVFKKEGTFVFILLEGVPLLILNFISASTINNYYLNFIK